MGAVSTVRESSKLSDPLGYRLPLVVPYSQRELVTIYTEASIFNIFLGLLSLDKWSTLATLRLP